MPDIEKLPYLESMVIEALKTKGVDDTETRQIAREWAVKDEERVDIDEDGSTRARIGHNLKFAELYAEGGAIAEAEIAYRGVFENAINEREYDMAGAALMKQIELAETKFDTGGEEGCLEAASTVFDVGDILEQYKDELSIDVFEKHRQIFEKVLAAQGLIEAEDGQLP